MSFENRHGSLKVLKFNLTDFCEFLAHFKNSWVLEFDRTGPGNPLISILLILICCYTSFPLKTTYKYHSICPFDDNMQYLATVMFTKCDVYCCGVLQITLQITTLATNTNQENKSIETLQLLHFLA